LFSYGSCGQEDYVVESTSIIKVFVDKDKLAALDFLVSIRNSTSSSAACLNLDECGKLFCDSSDDHAGKLDSVMEVTWPYFSNIGALKWKQW